MRVIGILVGLGLLAGCGIGDNAAGTAKLCTDLARGLAGSGLVGTPTLEQARAAGKSLDPLVTKPAAPALHEAVISLHQRLHALEAAHRRGDPDDVVRLAREARGDVRDVAKACHLPVDRFSG